MQAGVVINCTRRIPSGGGACPHLILIAPENVVLGRAVSVNWSSLVFFNLGCVQDEYVCPALCWNASEGLLQATKEKNRPVMYAVKNGHP